MKELANQSERYRDAPYLVQYTNKQPLCRTLAVGLHTRLLKEPDQVCTRIPHKSRSCSLFLSTAIHLIFFLCFVGHFLTIGLSSCWYVCYCISCVTCGQVTSGSRHGSVGSRHGSSDSKRERGTAGKRKRKGTGKRGRGTGGKRKRKDTEQRARNRDNWTRTWRKRKRSQIKRLKTARL